VLYVKRFLLEDMSTQLLLTLIRIAVVANVRCEPPAVSVVPANKRWPTLPEHSLDEYARDGQGDNHDVTVDVGRRLIDGMLAFADGAYSHAVELILPIRYKVIGIGGSHAQRDLVTQTLIAAAERSGQINLARALLAERLAVRPTEYTRLHYAKVGGAATAHASWRD
jgi:hypothetical protein